MQLQQINLKNNIIPTETDTVSEKSSEISLDKRINNSKLFHIQESPYQSLSLK